MRSHVIHAGAAVLQIADGIVYRPTASSPSQLLRRRPPLAAGLDWSLSSAPRPDPSSYPRQTGYARPPAEFSQLGSRYPDQEPCMSAAYLSAAQRQRGAGNSLLEFRWASGCVFPYLPTVSHLRSAHILIHTPQWGCGSIYSQSLTKVPIPQVPIHSPGGDWSLRPSAGSARAV